MASDCPIELAAKTANVAYPVDNSDAGRANIQSQKFPGARQLCVNFEGVLQEGSHKSRPPNNDIREVIDLQCRVEVIITGGSNEEHDLWHVGRLCRLKMFCCDEHVTAKIDHDSPFDVNINCLLGPHSQCGGREEWTLKEYSSYKIKIRISFSSRDLKIFSWRMLRKENIDDSDGFAMLTSECSITRISPYETRLINIYYQIPNGRSSLLSENSLCISVGWVPDRTSRRGNLKPDPNQRHPPGHVYLTYYVYDESAKGCQRSPTKSFKRFECRFCTNNMVFSSITKLRSHLESQHSEFYFKFKPIIPEIGSRCWRIYASLKSQHESVKAQRKSSEPIQDIDQKNRANPSGVTEANTVNALRHFRSTSVIKDHSTRLERATKARTTGLPTDAPRTSFLNKSSHSKEPVHDIVDLTLSDDADITGPPSLKLKESQPCASVLPFRRCPSKPNEQRKPASPTNVSSNDINKTQSTSVKRATDRKTAKRSRSASSANKGESTEHSVVKKAKTDKENGSSSTDHYKAWHNGRMPSPFLTKSRAHDALAERNKSSEIEGNTDATFGAYHALGTSQLSSAINKHMSIKAFTPEQEHADAALSHDSSEPINKHDAIPAARKVHRVPKAPAGVRLYRTTSKRMLEEGEEVSNSDECPDEPWLDIMHERQLYPLIRNLPKAEREFLIAFDRHMSRERLAAECYLPGCLTRFACANRKWLSANGGERQRALAKEIAGLQSRGVVSATVLVECMNIINSLGT